MFNCFEGKLCFCYLVVLPSSFYLYIIILRVSVLCLCIAYFYNANILKILFKLAYTHTHILPHMVYKICLLLKYAVPQ